MTDHLRIGELAKLLDTTTKTIRFYESNGLLSQPERTQSGYRLYDPEAVRQARVLVGLRRLGLSIEELKSLVNDCEGSLRQNLLAIMDEKISELDVTLSVLQGRRDDLTARQQNLLLKSRERLPDCVCDALLIPCTCNSSTT